MDLIAERDGTVRFNGSDIFRLKPYEIARLRLGFAPEDCGTFADRIIVLARGRLIADGDARTIRDNPQVREVYFGTGKTFAKPATTAGAA